MKRRIVSDRAVFWSAAIAAAVYWWFANWRLEQALWDALMLPVSMSDVVGQSLDALGNGLVSAITALSYAVSVLMFALVVRWTHLKTDGRTWAIPLTGFVLLFAFLGAESLILGDGLLAFMPLSRFAGDPGPALLAAILGLGAGCIGSWLLLKPGDTAPAGLTSAST